MCACACLTNVCVLRNEFNLFERVERVHVQNFGVSHGAGELLFVFFLPCCCNNYYRKSDALCLWNSVTIFFNLDLM